MFHGFAIQLSDAIGYSLFAQKVAASLTAIGILCLSLAAIGLYSVMSYAVGQRTQELGVRMALGASRFKIVEMVAKESLLLSVPGVFVGVAVAVVAIRVCSGMPVGVSAGDPLTIGGSAVLLIAVTLPASYLPARRAMRIDPMHRAALPIALFSYPPSLLR